MDGPVPHCVEGNCKYWTGEKGLPCAAFPDGIPDSIIYEGVDHTQPVKGDHGIQFEAVDQA